MVYIQMGINHIKTKRYYNIRTMDAISIEHMEEEILNNKLDIVDIQFLHNERFQNICMCKTKTGIKEIIKICNKTINYVDVCDKGFLYGGSSVYSKYMKKQDFINELKHMDTYIFIGPTNLGQEMTKKILHDINIQKLRINCFIYDDSMF